VIDARLLATPRWLFRLARLFLLTCLLMPVLGFLFAARPLCACVYLESERDVAGKTVNTYANEAYARWSLNNPGVRCPTDLSELSKYTDAPDARDPWGQSLQMVCPAPSVHFGVVSTGPDGKLDTADDIRSWERDRRAF
jgi:hypothetical protein